VIDLLQFNNFKLLTLLVALVAWLWLGARAAKAAWLITVLFTLELIIEAWAATLALNQQRNLWLYDLYFPLELGLLLTFLHAQWKDKRFTIGLVAAALIFSAIYATEIGPAIRDKEFASITYVTETVILIALCSTLLMKLALTSEISPARNPLFWFLFSTVVFFGGMLPLMGLLDVMSRRNPVLWTQLFLINDILFHVRFALVALPLFLLSQKRTTRDLEL
jgi:hypothetical protein